MPQRIFETCQVPGCHRKHKAAGYCATHYAQQRRGFPITPIKSRDRQHAERCSEEGCDDPVKAKGLCRMHYARLLRHGHTKYRNRTRPPKPCTVAGCENHHYSKGLCNQHYLRSRKAARSGLTMGELTQMLERQGGRCAICGGIPLKRDHRSDKVTDLCIDHDHETGRARGLLCDPCNRALGLFGDSPEILHAAIRYLETHRATPVSCETSGMLEGALT